MESNKHVQIEDLNNVEEIDNGELYGNIENNNLNNDYQFINQKREDRYDESEEGQNNMNENNYEEQNVEDEDEDDRLTYTLITLDLGDLIHIFEENNISFVDMLLLTKDDLKELQLKLYQRNRIHNFSTLFSKYAKNYSISEISDFFNFNQKFIFNSSIFDRVISPSNNNEFNENAEYENENNEEENLENINNEDNNEIYENENNINNDINNEQFDFENIGYTDYINYMNSFKNNNKMNNMQQKKFPTNYKNNFINNNFNNENNNLNNFNNIDYNSKNYFSDSTKNRREFNNNNLNKINTNNYKKTDKNKEVYQNKNISFQSKEKKRTKVNDKNKNLRNQQNNNNLINNNNNLMNNLINNESKLLAANRKSSNRINSVINKYLEIKQDADEFLEKLNKKKNDTKSKYNKYNILIKKRNTGKIYSDILNSNALNSYKNFQNSSTFNNNTSKKGISPKSINNTTGKKNINTKNEGLKFNQKENNLNEDENIGTSNINEFDIDIDINNEYQKMISQIEELEQIKMDYNSYNHLNQIKKYINDKGDSITLDDISKINLVKNIIFQKTKKYFHRLILS